MADTTYRERLDALQDHDIWRQMGDYPGGPKECKDKTVYSSSRLSAYCKCRWDYKLTYEDHVPEETRSLGSWRGTMTHRAVHLLHKEGGWDAVPEVFKIAQAESMEELETRDTPWSTQDCSTEKVAGAVEESLTMVSQYARHNNPQALGPDYGVLATEIRGCMIVEHPKTHTCYRVTMELDQVRQDGNGLNITDIKTPKQEPGPTFLRRSKQLTIYGLGLQHATFLMGEGRAPWKFWQYPKSMTYLYLPNLIPYKRATEKQGVRYEKGSLRGPGERPDIFPVERTIEQYEAMQAEVCRIIQGIRMKMFMRDDDDMRCKMCRHQRACDEGLVARANEMDLADMSDLY
jgi:hypothetical protein